MAGLPCSCAARSSASWYAAQCLRQADAHRGDVRALVLGEDHVASLVAGSVGGLGCLIGRATDLEHLAHDAKQGLVQLAVLHIRNSDDAKVALELNAAAPELAIVGVVDCDEYGRVLASLGDVAVRALVHVGDPVADAVRHAAECLRRSEKHSYYRSPRLNYLTRTETDVLRLLVCGRTPGYIAKALFLGFDEDVGRSLANMAWKLGIAGDKLRECGVVIDVRPRLPDERGITLADALHSRLGESQVDQYEVRVDSGGGSLFVFYKEQPEEHWDLRNVVIECLSDLARLHQATHTGDASQGWGRYFAVLREFPRLIVREAPWAFRDPNGLDVSASLARFKELSGKPVTVNGFLVIGKGMYLEDTWEVDDPRDAARVFLTSSVRLRIGDASVVDAIDPHANCWVGGSWAYKGPAILEGTLESDPSGAPGLMRVTRLRFDDGVAQHDFTFDEAGRRSPCHCGSRR